MSNGNGGENVDLFTVFNVVANFLIEPMDSNSSWSLEHFVEAGKITH